MIQRFKLPLSIAWRYMRAKRRNRFISFISIVSVLGIALGITVLITVLSVMNGFDEEIRGRFFAVAPEITVVSSEPLAVFKQDLQRSMAKTQVRYRMAPFINGKGLLMHDGEVSGVEVLGIEPQAEMALSAIGKKMQLGRLDSLQEKQFNMVLGVRLSHSLGLLPGSSVNLFTPQVTVTPFGASPRFRRFTVSGVFATNSGFGFDDGLVYINLSDARRLFIKGHLLRGFHIKLDSPYMAPMVANQLRRSLPISSTVSDWTDQFGAFFKALSMEKTMMFFILLLIVAVAAFNLVSSLVMLVHEKRADIAILRTLGMQPLRIMWIFIFQGALIGFFGMLLGVGLGIFVSLNAPHFVDWLQQLLHVQLISASVYFVNYLPVSIHLKDVLWVGGLAWLMGILATIYPAILAFKTSPAEVLRRE